MNFVIEKIKDFYLRDSRIENIFINEYMPAAPGDYVKVFLYGYMYAEHSLPMDHRMMAQQLGISETKVTDAWDYWEQMGAIRKLYMDEDGKVDFSVEFLNLKELMYGKSDTTAVPDAPQEVTLFGNESVRKMFDQMENRMGRAFSTTEVKRVLSWVADQKFPPELVLFCVDYCLDKGKTSLRYMEGVLNGWAEEGLMTVESVTMHLAEVDQRYYQYRRVLRALGFSRNATEEEKRMMDRWFDEFGYNMDRVLEACARTAGIPNPNFNYVNSVLLNWKDDAERRGETDVNKKITVTQAQLRQYYEYLREKAAEEAERRTEEIYQKIPRIREIDHRAGELGATLSKALILGDDGGQGLGIHDQLEDLAEERAILLTEHDYEMDYTDVRYTCDKCHDTGITDLGERCSCVPMRMEEAEIWLKQSGDRNGKKS